MRFFLPGVFHAVVVAQLRASEAANGRGANGLSVVTGVLVKDGRPYRGIGANYFSLFHHRLNLSFSPS